jgi:hypothetical protein
MPRNLSIGSLSHLATSAMPTIDDINLAHVLNGETCPPISFHDFSVFVTRREHTAENLLFVVWFRNYQAQWQAQDEEKRRQVPIPSTRLGDRYEPYGYLDKRRETKVKDTLEPESVVPSLPFQALAASTSIPRTPVSHKFKVCTKTVNGQPCRCGDETHHPPSPSTHAQPHAGPSLHHSSRQPALPPIGTTYTEPAHQPMREEAERAFVCFMQKGGSRELGISDDLRQFTRTALDRSTAPEVVSLPLAISTEQPSFSLSTTRSTRWSKRRVCLTFYRMPRRM